jgi:hypothetical protein
MLLYLHAQIDIPSSKGLFLIFNRLGVRRTFHTFTALYKYFTFYKRCLKRSCIFFVTLNGIKLHCHSAFLAALPPQKFVRFVLSMKKHKKVTILSSSFSATELKYAKTPGKLKKVYVENRVIFK